MADDPIIAEVRKAREEIFKEAGRDLRELVRQLNERARASGRKLVDRSKERDRPTRSGPKPRE